MFSDNLAHKCCKAAGIRSKARKGYSPPGEESEIFPNRILGHWNAAKPVEIVVSDMTMLKVGKKYWEWIIFLDTFSNEILAHSVTDIPGNNKPYYDCLDVLNRLTGKLEEQKLQVVFHTDQGAVSSSKAFCHAHNYSNILRSMSRVGTPTENPIIESLIGWMKNKLYLDYDLYHSQDVPALLDQYVSFFIREDMPLWVTNAQFSKDSNWTFLNGGLRIYFSLTPPLSGRMVIILYVIFITRQQGPRITAQT